MLSSLLPDGATEFKIVSDNAKTHFRPKPRRAMRRSRSETGKLFMNPRLLLRRSLSGTFQRARSRWDSIPSIPNKMSSSSRRDRKQRWESTPSPRSQQSKLDQAPTLKQRGAAHNGSRNLIVESS